jgi:hypothetical protein
LVNTSTGSTVGADPPDALDRPARLSMSSLVVARRRLLVQLDI